MTFKKFAQVMYIMIIAALQNVGIVFIKYLQKRQKFYMTSYF